MLPPPPPNTNYVCIVQYAETDLCICFILILYGVVELVWDIVLLKFATTTRGLVLLWEVKQCVANNSLEPPQFYTHTVCTINH